MYEAFIVFLVKWTSATVHRQTVAVVQQKGGGGSPLKRKAQTLANPVLTHQSPWRPSCAAATPTPPPSPPTSSAASPRSRTSIDLKFDRVKLSGGNRKLPVNIATLSCFAIALEQRTYYLLWTSYAI